MITHKGKSTMTQEECERLFLAAVLHADSNGVSEQDLKRITKEFAHQKTMMYMWDRVLHGELGVEWDASKEEVRFHTISDDEAAFRKQVIAAAASGMPPATACPSDYACG